MCFPILIPFFENGLSTSEVDISRREGVEALMQALVVIVCDEGGDLLLELTREIIIVQQDPFFSV